ncbi:serine/threonine-protein kinase [Aspergillus clavatus NRRL 1]|uniref:non-specific serine/threonine protein kinase n=1 Tax=Aspergillus clavatus (strain ATCC 1007 / CBS 513.65 / DSM 816 / NCTC 3887 / NRRL 1 / QM 1276 / 107) TaxID=344612 RepID=A1CTQ0_ASPCL|nr:protein kinase, putative [Aspergillus clavatus NRRL 1]EAW06687.1 protein kinase, putative [Aspergillus clavatus NRRL 1]
MDASTNAHLASLQVVNDHPQSGNDPVDPENGFCTSSNEQGVSGESGSTSPTQSSRDRISTRLRRNRSKLLSFLGLRTPSNAARLAPPGEVRPSPVDSAEPSQSFHSYPDGDNRTGQSTPSIEGQNIHAAVASAQSSSNTSFDAFRCHLSLTDERVTAPTELQPRLLKTDIVEPIPTRIEIRCTNSTSAVLTDIVSSKLSTAFGYPTVIRRTKPRSRPSIRAAQFVSPHPPLSKQGDSANDAPDSDDPSTSPSNGGSPVSTNSTPPTSEEPCSSQDSWKHLSQNVTENGQQLTLRDRGTHRILTPIQELPCVTPSIHTVEATANAKIFLETHFNTMWSNEDPRFQRQTELEKYIHAYPLTPEEQVKAKKNWLTQEREHLRQFRVLKSRPYSARRDETVSLAGFEVVKVLGRGSFGVVRLVREKGSEENHSRCADERASSSFRAARLNPLRSALAGSEKVRRHTMTGARKNVFAMKVIRKSVMIRNCQEGHLRAERDFLVASAKSRWIVPLIASFQDHNYLYLIMDYMVGGDFLGVLMRRNILSEEHTKWYAVEMILCIEEAHKLHWIHRDIKPDNFLISASGHMKISDFGLAFDGHWAHDQVYYNDHRHSLLEKLGIQIEGDREDQEGLEKSKPAGTTQIPEANRRDRAPPLTNLLDWRDTSQKRRLARSIVGTSQYMAPEIVRGEVYDGRCDWWSLGIIIYECLYGFTPFASMDRQETKWKVHHHVQSLFFPSDRPADKMVSAEAIDLINRLLQDREFRLCSRQYRVRNDPLPLPPGSRHLFHSHRNRSRNYQGSYVYPNDAEEIKAHPFFLGIDWASHHLTQPPFIPKVDGWEDTRYFDDNGMTGLDQDDVSISSDANQGQDEPEGNDLHEPDPEEEKVQHEGNRDGKKEKKDKLGRKEKNRKKRPRDKILRDPRVSKVVLDIRKRGAFPGYTYRRPKAVALALAPERGRSIFSRGQLSELYGY